MLVGSVFESQPQHRVFRDSTSNFEVVYKIMEHYIKLLDSNSSSETVSQIPGQYLRFRTALQIPK